MSERKATRRFNRIAPRVYRFSQSWGMAFVFGAARPVQMWAWGVWGPDQFCEEGIAFSLKTAREKANKYLDELVGIAKRIA